MAHLPKTKQYLLETLDKHTTANPNCEFLEALGYLNEASPSSSMSGFGGGSGTGPTTGTKTKDTSLSGTLFGPDTTGLFGTSPMVSAAGLHIAGSALDTAADAVDALGNVVGSGAAKGILAMMPRAIKNNPVIGPAASMITKGAFGTSSKVISTMLRNLADISGKSYFDQNLKNIGTANIANVISGAGKPFAPLVVPERKESGVSSRSKAIAAAKEAEAAKAYRSRGYAIP